MGPSKQGPARLDGRIIPSTAPDFIEAVIRPGFGGVNSSTTPWMETGLSAVGTPSAISNRRGENGSAVQLVPHC